MSDSSRPPSRVVKRDGSVVPFEPEKIQHTLFAAAAQLGSPNAFLVRELTDGVLHFLTANPDDPPPTTTEIAETVCKVVRELGYPQISQAYRERLNRKPVADPPPTWELSPDQSFLDVLRSAGIDRLRQHSLASAWPAEFVSADRERLIFLTGLDTPLEMAGAVVNPFAGDNTLGLGILESIFAVREYAGQFIAIDSPEYVLAGRAGTMSDKAYAFARELHLAAQVAGLAVIVNLNTAEPPPWAAAASGPLFPSAATAGPDEIRAMRAELSMRLAEAAPNVSIFWHVRDPDSSDPPDLLPTSAQLEWVFDRPKRAVVLGPGLDRRHPAVLTQVGIDLAGLVDRLGAGPIDRDLYLKKLGSLARFAKSAGHVRRDYLRKHARPSARSGFLLERARLVVIPIGLNRAACAVLGRDSTSPGLVADFARDMLRAIRSALESDRPGLLETVIDSPLAQSLPAVAASDTDVGTVDAAFAFAPQLRSASALQHAAGGGRMAMSISPTGSLPDNSLLDSAWHAGAMRLRVVHSM